MNYKMKEQLKHFLEKMPVFYRFIAKGYTYSALKIRHLKYLLVGTKVMEKEWATRHLREGERERDDWGKVSDDWIRGYRDSLEHPHRSFLIENISERILKNPFLKNPLRLIAHIFDFGYLFRTFTPLNSSFSRFSRFLSIATAILYSSLLFERT